MVSKTCAAIIAGLEQLRTLSSSTVPPIHLLRNEDLRRQMGVAGFQRCTEYFEVSKTIRQLEQFYCTLTTSPG